MHELAQAQQRLANGYFFDSGAVETLIGNYQATRAPELLGEIIQRCEPIALSLIRGRSTIIFKPEDELLSCVHRKLLVSVPQFD